jgi:alpha-L-rhamnosidase
MPPADPTPQISGLRFEYGLPVVGTHRPRISWTVETNGAWAQQRYELQCAGETLTFESTESTFVRWPFEPLQSRERRAVRVRATSTEGQTTEWSEELIVEAGLLDISDWKASFVGPSKVDDAPCPLLRHEFVVDRVVESARLYVTALGVYEAHLNGSPIGDEVLAPNWTSYNNRLRYQTFDVTDRLTPGVNVLGAILGDGWYRGRLVHSVHPYGDRLALLAQLEIAFADGTRQLVTSDTSWLTAPGPILESSIYDGERYDARLEKADWSTPSYDDRDWQPVEIVERPLPALVVPSDPPIRRIEEVAVTETFLSQSGKRIVDFGQNLVGRLRITLNGAAGDTVVLRHAEVLEDGELALKPLRTARPEDCYTLKGGGEETWEPLFTFHGFRYAELDGWPGEFDPGSVTAIVLHSDLQRTGWFECSNALVNRLHENAVWSMRGNFVGLPTDCPQRDERLGWTGDLQVFAPAASFLFDVNGILASWLADLAAEQAPDGRVPSVVPDAAPSPETGRKVYPEIAADWGGEAVAGWGDAAAIVPWVLYQRFGDRGLLERQWPSMRAWVDHVEQLAGPARIWQNGFQFGDWLDPFAPPEAPSEGRTPAALVATAYFARSAQIVARAAETLGLMAEAVRYESLAQEVKAAFRAAFTDELGGLSAPSETGLAMILEFALAEDAETTAVVARQLRELIARNGYVIATGFLGTPIICDALCEAGDLAGAYQLVLQTECPSWLYQVTMGATTIWERWDSLLPDGRVNPGEMTSFNHYAFGAIVDWLHRRVAGIEPDAPGYRRIRFRPQPGGGITHASARHITPYGPAAIAWSIDGDQLDVHVEVPANTNAEIASPDGAEIFQVPSGTHSRSFSLSPTDVVSA